MLGKAVKLLREHLGWASLLAALLPILTLGTIFTVSMLMAIGPEMVTFVDKGHLLVLMAFYVSGAVVLTRFVVAALAILDAMARNSIEDWIGAQVVQKIERRKRYKSYPADEVAVLAERIGRRRKGRRCFMLHFWVPVVGVAILWAWSARSTLWLIASVTSSEDMLLNAAVAVVCLATAYYARFKRHHLSAYRYPLALGNLYLAVTAFQAGGVWVNYMQEAAPRVDVVLSSGSFDASVVIPATAGFLAFVGQETAITFVPWSDVIAVRARQADTTAEKDGK